jgi:hypothetical protein
MVVGAPRVGWYRVPADFVFVDRGFWAMGGVAIVTALMARRLKSPLLPVRAVGDRWRHVGGDRLGI